MSDRRRGWMRPVMLGLVFFQLAYVVVANAFLSTGWGHGVLNRRPEKLTAEWQRAWTVLPGLLHVSGLDLAGTSRKVSWGVRLDRGHVFLFLPSLLRRHFWIVTGVERGAEVRAALVEDGAVDSARRKTGPGWRVTLGGMRVSGLRRLAVGGYEIRGAGQVAGRARFQIRGPMRLELSELDFAAAEAVRDGVVVATEVQLRSHFETAPHVPGRGAFEELLRGVDGHVEIHAVSDDVGFVRRYLAAAPWFQIGGAGTLDVDADVSGGVLAPHSRLAFAGPAVAVRFSDFRAEGAGRLDAEVSEDGEVLAGGLLLNEYAIVRLSDGVELLDGAELELALETAPTLVFDAEHGVRGRFVMGPAAVRSLPELGRYVPEATGLEITGGHATLGAELTFDSASRRGEGALAVDARELTSRFGEVEAGGRVALRGRLSEIDLVGGRMGLGGSTIDLSEVWIRDGRGERARRWAGAMRLVDGTVTWAPLEAVAPREPTPAPAIGDSIPLAAAAVVEGRLEATLDDSLPIVLAMQRRLPKLAWLQRLLTFPEVAMAGDLRFGGPRFRLRGGELSGGRADQFEVRAELDIEGEVGSGAVYTRYRGVDAALSLAEGEREWRVFRARQAYEEFRRQHLEQAGADDREGAAAE